MLFGWAFIICLLSLGAYGFFADIITLPTNATRSGEAVQNTLVQVDGNVVGSEVNQNLAQGDTKDSAQELAQLSKIIGEDITTQSHTSGDDEPIPIHEETDTRELTAVITPIPSRILEKTTSLPSTTQPSVDTIHTIPITRTDLTANDTLNILILGSDRRPDRPNWRTDVIMIVMLDMERNAAGIISLPRDIYIDNIPNHYANRINAIDYLGEVDEPDGGGPRLLGTVLEEQLGIPIHHYLRFEFESFKEIVDALGGVEIAIDCAIADRMKEEDIAIDLQPGTHRLNGAEALSYVRSRRIGGDLERARRQQRFAWAVRDQVLNDNWLPRLPALYDALSDSVQSDIGIIQTIQLARFALGLTPESVHGLVISGTDMLEESWAGGMFVFIADWEKISEVVHDIFNRPSFLETNTVGETGDKKRCS